MPTTPTRRWFGLVYIKIFKKSKQTNLFGVRTHSCSPDTFTSPITAWPSGEIIETCLFAGLYEKKAITTDCISNESTNYTRGRCNLWHLATFETFDFNSYVTWLDFGMWNFSLVILLFFQKFWKKSEPRSLKKNRFLKHAKDTVVETLSVSQHPNLKHQKFGLFQIFFFRKKVFLRAKVSVVKRSFKIAKLFFFKLKTYIKMEGAHFEQTF